MTNLFAISIPQLTGRALFPARPAVVLAGAATSEAASLPGVAEAVIAFEEMLIGTQAQAHAASGLPDAGTAPSTDEPADNSQFTQDQPPLPLSGIVQVPVLAVPVRPVEIAPVPVAGPVAAEEAMPAASALATAVFGSTTSSGRARISYAPTTELGNDVSRLRVVSNVPLATTAAALQAPTTPAAGVANLGASAGIDAALSSALQEAVGAGSERAMNWFVPGQSAPAMPLIAAAAGPVASPKHVDAPGSQSLTTVLGERLQVQINQRSEHALIRLDPPSMGSIEIVIRHEAGHLQVQLRASNGEVARQLHAIGDTLRQDLVQRQHGEVSVQVWDGSRDSGDGRRHQRPVPQWRDDPGRALNESADGEPNARFALNEWAIPGNSS